MITRKVIPDNPGFSRRETKKFGRALSTAALLTSVHELPATDGSDDGDLILRFGLRGESIPPNGME
jgi:hypothetical protein